jgi:hypothetical protein
MPSLARFQSSQPARRPGVVQFKALLMMWSRHAIPVDSATHVPHKRQYGTRGQAPHALRNLYLLQEPRVHDF